MITLTVPLPPTALRRNHGGHWRGAKAAKDAYAVSVYQSALEHGWRASQPLQGSLKADITWRQTGHGDTDNALAGCKALLDVLGMAPATMAGQDRTYLGVYESDGQITEIAVRRERVATKGEQGITVTIQEAG